MRKRYFGDTDAAQEYTRDAAKLLAQVKQQMGFAGLSQLSRRIVLPNGTVLVASSVFGQDEVQVYAPVLQRAEVNPPTDARSGFDPYLFIGVRISTGPKDEYGWPKTYIELNVWEDETREFSENGARNEILASRMGGGNDLQPLPSPKRAYLTLRNGASEFVYYTSNKLWLSDGETLAVDPLDGPGNHAWDEVAVWDDQDETGVMEAIGKPKNRMRYVATVALLGDDCDETKTTCEFLAIVGRGRYQTVQRGEFTIEKATNFNFATIPLGYFDTTELNEGCSKGMQDYGENPHGHNWWQGALIIDMPDRYESESVNTARTGRCTVEKSYTPSWGFTPAAMPEQSRLCPRYRSFSVNLVSAAADLTITGLGGSPPSQVNARLRLLGIGSALPVPWLVSIGLSPTYPFTSVDPTSGTVTGATLTVNIENPDTTSYHLDTVLAWSGSDLYEAYLQGDTAAFAVAFHVATGHWATIPLPGGEASYVGYYMLVIDNDGVTAQWITPTEAEAFNAAHPTGHYTECLQD